MGEESDNDDEIQLKRYVYDDEHAKPKPIYSPINKMKYPPRESSDLEIHEPQDNSHSSELGSDTLSEASSSNKQTHISTTPTPRRKSPVPKQSSKLAHGLYSKAFLQLHASDFYHHNVPRKLPYPDRYVSNRLQTPKVIYYTPQTREPNSDRLHTREYMRRPRSQFTDIVESSNDPTVDDSDSSNVTTSYRKEDVARQSPQLPAVPLLPTLRLHQICSTSSTPKLEPTMTVSTSNTDDGEDNDRSDVTISPEQEDTKSPYRLILPLPLSHRLQTPKAIGNRLQTRKPNSDRLKTQEPIGTFLPPTFELQISDSAIESDTREDDSDKSNKTASPEEEHIEIQSPRSEGLTAAEWLASVGSTSNSVYKDPPKPLLDLVERICSEQHIENVTWAQSTRKENEIIFTGKNIELVKEKIIQRLQKNFPDFSADFVDADSTCSHLSGKIKKFELCRDNNPRRMWKSTYETATSELIVTANQVHKHDQRPGLFAVTCAHLLLGHTFAEYLFRISNPGHAKIELNRRKREINSMIDTNVYRLSVRLGDDQEEISDLLNPFMLCYRFWNRYERNEHGRGLKCFRNDIALLPIESKVENHGQYEFLIDVTLEDLRRAVGQKVLVKDKVGEIVHMNQALRDEVKIAYHLAFKIIEGGQLERGDSGSLVFVEVNGEKYAIGMLQAKRKTADNYPDHIYEAIILCHALKEVESEYPHLVGPFSHYSTKVSGARPPCSN